MPLSDESLEIITQLAVERDAYKKNWDAICDLFEVPEKERRNLYVSTQIIERIHTYLTGYTVRKSHQERQNGAAFHEPETPEVTKDPLTHLTDSLRGRP